MALHARGCWRLAIDLMLPPFPAPPLPLGRRLRVSIVVNNHNYETFLREALMSAIAQRDEDVEVVVVDDGSTDSSREVIASFAGQVHPIFQDNLGQKAAFNTGFAAASGDVVMFLDADDRLAPDAASAIASAFRAHPEAGRVVFRLEAVDQAGRPIGALMPPSRVRLPAGDVRHAVLSFPDDLAWPPTSGNAFAKWALARVLPLTVDDDPLGADLMLHALVPLLAPVVAVDKVFGAYRVHDRNPHSRRRSASERSRSLLRVATDSHAAIERLAWNLGYGPVRPRSVTIAAHRLLSLRLGGSGHPIRNDTLRRALGAGVRASWGRDDVAIGRRMLYVAWFAAAATAPRPVVRALARKAFGKAN